MKTIVKEKQSRAPHVVKFNVTITGVQSESDLCQATRLERHVWWEAKKHNLDYDDLLYATITIAAKYKGKV